MINKSWKYMYSSYNIRYFGQWLFSLHPLLQHLSHDYEKTNKKLNSKFLFDIFNKYEKLCCLNTEHIIWDNFMQHWPSG